VWDLTLLTHIGVSLWYDIHPGELSNFSAVKFVHKQQYTGVVMKWVCGGKSCTIQAQSWWFMTDSCWLSWVFLFFYFFIFSFSFWFVLSWTISLWTITQSDWQTGRQTVVVLPVVVLAGDLIWIEGVDYFPSPLCLVLLVTEGDLVCISWSCWKNPAIHTLVSPHTQLKVYLN